MGGKRSSVSAFPFSPSPGVCWDLAWRRRGCSWGHVLDNGREEERVLWAQAVWGANKLWFWNSVVEGMAICGVEWSRLLAEGKLGLGSSFWLQIALLVPPQKQYGFFLKSQPFLFQQPTYHQLLPWPPNSPGYQPSTVEPLPPVQIRSPC